MDEIRALNALAGQSIPSILGPTFKTFAPLLLKNKSAIQSITPTEEIYGPHPRQKLDIYRSQSASSDSPILIFFYGGGLVRGDKCLDAFPEQLVYHNVGTFYASRGITTIIPDYRLVNSSLGGHDAVFPSGGEDVSLVLKWLEDYNGLGSEKKDLYIMGNSAGGVHISTFLFAGKFLGQRRKYGEGGKGLELKGAIELAVPLHFETAASGRWDMLEKYYGSKYDVKVGCPHGLLEALTKTGMSRQEAGVPKVLALVGEFDPHDEIAGPMEDCVESWKKAWGEGIELRVLKGHNHISPPTALMSRDAEGEKWGEDVAKWIKG